MRRGMPRPFCIPTTRELLEFLLHMYAEKGGEAHFLLVHQNGNIGEERLE